VRSSRSADAILDTSLDKSGIHLSLDSFKG
jgi:hypothetical protein